MYFPSIFIVELCDVEIVTACIWGGHMGGWGRDLYVGAHELSETFNYYVVNG